MNIHIGDKVRFLNDVGGGTVTGFQGKDIVLVSDADGFEIPTPANEVVVIETDDYNFAKPDKKSKATTTDRPTRLEEEAEEDEPDPAEMQITYRPMAQERRGADAPALMLAFVPTDLKRPSDSTLEVYLVNDCNYYLHFILLSVDEQQAHLLYEGEIMPNTKLFLEEISHSDLGEWEKLNVQVHAYKRDKAFVLRQPVNADIRLAPSKFYKLHAYAPTPFFDTPALLIDIVKDGEAVRPLPIDTAKIEEAMHTAALAQKDDTLQPSAPSKGKRKSDRDNSVEEVDLHATALFDTMVGLQPKDILDYQLKVFRETMDAHLGRHGRRVVFIHGKGEGVLRKALLKELAQHYKQCRHQDASFREYGFGATMVTF